jgi:hypothetical protein
MIDRAANWRCWATESATSLRAAALSSSVVKTLVVRGGISSRGLGGSTTSFSAAELMVAREDRVRGGRDGSSRGVEVVEFKVEDGRTRFARRKVKNAVQERLVVV